MQLDSRAGVSIAALIIYSPLSVAALCVCIKHGFGRSSGWVYILILCLIRIIGSACNLAAHSTPSTSLYRAVFILDSIGISPLLFATLGLLMRLFTWMQKQFETTMPMMYFRLTQLIFTGGLIFSIVGGTKTRNTANPSTLSQVAIVVYLVGLAACAVFLGSAWARLRRCGQVPIGERSLVYAVAVALPLIFIRTVFSALAVFLHDATFSIVQSPVVVYVSMVVLEELLVVVVYIVVGWKLD